MFGNFRECLNQKALSITNQEEKSYSKTGRKPAQTRDTGRQPANPHQSPGALGSHAPKTMQMT